MVDFVLYICKMSIFHHQSRDDGDKNRPIAYSAQKQDSPSKKVFRAWHCTVSGGETSVLEL